MLLPTLLALHVVVPPPAPGRVASVNDPRSPGVLGDALLSLDEAVRLANGTLLPAQLSAGELAQLSGLGADVTRIEIDAALTPVLTLSTATTPLTGNGSGVVTIAGLGAPNQPLLLGGSVPWILAVRTGDAAIAGLDFAGGAVGIDVLTGPLGTAMPAVTDCGLLGQIDAGVALHGSGTWLSRVMLHAVHFRNMARGILVDDRSAGGLAMLEAEHCAFDGVGLCLDVAEAGVGGSTSMAELFRCEAKGGQSFARVRRTLASSNQALMLQFTHCAIDTIGDAIDLQGSAAGRTMLHHHHSRVHATPGTSALRCWPRTALFDIHGSEMDFRGDVAIAANLFTQRIWQQNNRFADGTITFDVDGSQPNLLWNHYENCAIVVAPNAITPVRLRSCELVDSTVAGQSPFAPVTLLHCWRSGGGATGNVHEQEFAPAPWLAAATVSPPDPVLGGTVDLGVDAPSDVVVAFTLTLAYSRPLTSQEPFRFYGDPSRAEILAFATGQSTTTIAVPNAPWLLEHEFYVAPVAVAGPSLGYAPTVMLPAGGLLQPRR